MYRHTIKVTSDFLYPLPFKVIAKWLYYNLIKLMLNQFYNYIYIKN